VPKSLKIKVGVKIVIIEESNRDTFTKKIEELIEKHGLDSVTVMSSGTTIQSRARDYWAIVCITETPQRRVTT
jgi:hypothetical protein